MTVLAKTRLTIREQGELLNQIAGTYKDFFRAAMEYVDNFVDAAVILQRSGDSFQPVLKIHVDSTTKKVVFTDNCGGMTPEELCRLLSEVGRSNKKAVPWANGQFGFGVHAFRAFAKEAVFVSRKKRNQEAMIKIDRGLNENAEVPCEVTKQKQLDKPGTRVIISKFDPQVFKKANFFKSLVSEIEHHFDDVLRAGLVKILVQEDNSRSYECRFFDFSQLPGIPFKRDISIKMNSRLKNVVVDLKILDRIQDNRLPVLTNKQRRIQSVVDLKSYKNFLRDAGFTNYVWSNPFVVGSIEINDLCSPNLSRDDLKDSLSREALYEQLMIIQKELEVLVRETMDKKAQDSYRKLGNVMSECLSQILRSFRLQFEKLAPTVIPGDSDRSIQQGVGDVPFGGEQPGGGGPGPDGHGSGGDLSHLSTSGPGNQDTGSGTEQNMQRSGPGTSRETVVRSSGPEIKFQNHTGADRVIDLGNSLVVNTLHPDFVERNSSKSGKIKLDSRLLNYVSLVVAPPCVNRLFQRSGRVPGVSEVGTNIINLSTKLEQHLAKTILGGEIETEM